MKPLRHFTHLRVVRQRTRAPKLSGQMGLTQLGEGLNPVIPFLKTVPAACPWCGNACLRHQPGTPEVNCFCGWEGLMEPPRTPYGPKWR